MGVVRVKCVLLGDSTVGKTAITQAYHSDGTSFPKSYMMSTGVDLLQKFVQLGEDNKDVVDLFMFDSAGKEVFHQLNEASWDKVGMFVLVYDITNKTSFKNCQQWLKKIKQFSEPGKSIPGVVIGNKGDLKDRREVEANEGNAFAVKHGLVFFECSAKQYEGIDVVFKHLANEVHQLYQQSSENVQQIE
nr:intraflagellar transport protein 27 homolog [Ciona intestinalis]|eukprot:XP_009858222.1 intraflagellar transport protein 27 homolog [Ciona intestinalis]